jgi:signal transduction histidine kinase
VTRPLSLRAHLVIGAVFLLIGLFFGSIILWHITLGHHDPPDAFFALVRHAHDVALACLGFIALGVWQIQRGWRSIDQVRDHLADVHEQPERRLSGRYPAEIAPLAADVNRLLDQRDAMVARANLTAGDLAHGLKTPLAILTQDAARAERDGHTELAASIGAQVDRMRRQVDAHLARARLDASRHRTAVAVRLRDTIDGIVRTVTRMYGDRGVAFDAQVPEDVEVLATRDDLEEVLGNVLDNACKWARSSCSVTAAAAGPHIRVVIDDDGPGMTKEMRDRTPFRGLRADVHPPGSGLGLSIARDLVQAYGGRMSLEASPPGGLRVVIELPVPGSRG